MNPKQVLLVPSDKRLPAEVDGEGWHAKLLRCDNQVNLNLRSPANWQTAEELLQKSLVVHYEQDRSYWWLSESTRYWYHDEPDAISDGVVLLPRISVSTCHLGGERFGIAFDTGHLVRTQQSVAELLLDSAGRERFEQLRRRDKGRKGTLIYNTGRSRRSKCYFFDYADGVTCATSGVFVIGQDRYESLWDYYRRRYPRLDAQPNDTVVYVKFDWGQRAVPVAAKLLHLRLKLDPKQLPSQLRRMSMSPFARRERVLNEWNSKTESAITQCGVQFSGRLWQPAKHETEQLEAPDLIFGEDERLEGPIRQSPDAYRRYYRDREKMLRRFGVYRVDPTVSKDIWIVVPPTRERWSEELQAAFVESVRADLEQLTKQKFRLRVVTAESAKAASSRLQRELPATSLVVFDELEMGGAAYYLMSEELHRWRLKRVTRGQLEHRWHDRRRARGGRESDRAERAWNDVVFHTVLDLLDQMGAVPWRIGKWGYDACVAIDVSEERRFCAVSFLLCRNPETYAGCDGFWRYVDSWTKAETRRETINPVRLEDRIAGIVEAFPGSRLSPINSVLVLRDGRECGDEPQAIDRGLDRWKQLGVLAQSAQIDVVDYHKRTVKNLRTWIATLEDARNVLEGRAVYTNNSALVCLTGAATLPREATVDPCLLVGREEADIRRAAAAVFALGQHNYLSPKKAYRDAQPMRDADHELKRKMAMEVRGLR